MPFGYYEMEFLNQKGESERVRVLDLEGIIDMAMASLTASQEALTILRLLKPFHKHNQREFYLQTLHEYCSEN